MLRIAICDDDEQICGALETMLGSMRDELGESLELEVYSSAEELWADSKDGCWCDLVFLDIELPGSTGLELAQRIRGEQDDHLVQIAYISAKTQYTLELFATQPIDFLQKPLQKAQVRRAVQLTQKIKQTQDLFFDYTEERISKRILERQIVALSIKGKAMSIMTTDGATITYRGSMAEAMARLEKHGFIRINQSEAVNERYVKSYSRNHVCVKDDLILSISRRYQGTALEQLRAVGGATS